MWSWLNKVREKFCIITDIRHGKLTCESCSRRWASLCQALISTRLSRIAFCDVKAPLLVPSLTSLQANRLIDLKRVKRTRQRNPVRLMPTQLPPDCLRFQPNWTRRRRRRCSSSGHFALRDHRHSKEMQRRKPRNSRHWPTMTLSMTAPPAIPNLADRRGFCQTPAVPRHAAALAVVSSRRQRCLNRVF